MALHTTQTWKYFINFKMLYYYQYSSSTSSEQVLQIQNQFAKRVSQHFQCTYKKPIDLYKKKSVKKFTGYLYVH